jgi:hypothetical protein
MKENWDSICLDPEKYSREIFFSLELKAMDESQHPFVKYYSEPVIQSVHIPQKISHLYFHS